ncbi:hypothetical protein [Pedobacter hartonius]|uniref:Uncharacterized protein n=1 Tax=Pedobacter hartonius TaxID=425514 RepID=A0A1H4G8I3_9SPHI|nr:hypothetical protein [Pedobacter hartonius]SEB05320.1 hypothetical protein SAMN05443550_10979 [Pedobacter hartonius]
MATANHFSRTANAGKKADREIHTTGKGRIAFHQDLKQKIKKGSLDAVSYYNQYIKSLLSIHKESSETLNWDQLVNEPEPKLPLRQSLNQGRAEQEYRDYRPTVLDKMLGQSKKKKKELLRKAEQAKRNDDMIYNATLREFKNNRQDWKTIQLIIKGIREADPAAYKDAIEFFDPFHQISQFGSILQYETFSEHIVVNLHVNSTEIVPDYIVCEATSGKVTHSEMSMPEFHELCHHHLCGSVLRVGRETFALLPVKFVYVNVYSNLWNTATGLAESKVVLSVKFNPDDLMKMNFNALNGPDYLTNFQHNLDFSISKGFSPTQVLKN